MAQLSVIPASRFSPFGPTMLLAVRLFPMAGVTFVKPQALNLRRPASEEGFARRTSGPWTAPARGGVKAEDTRYS
jgi:hypothetical protein